MNSKVKALASAATLVVAAGAAAISVAGAAHAAVGCRVTYTVVNQWPGGFQGGVRLTNLGDPLVGWSLGFAFPDPNQRIDHGWSASWSQSGAGVSATSMSWNANVATGQSVDLGFIGAFSGANPVPNPFTVNGVTCDGSTTTTTTTTQPPTSTRPPTTTTRPPTSTQPPTGTAPALRVSGNRIVTSDGRPYRLLGVNRSSGEYACVQGKGQWDFGPVDQASVDALKGWNIRAIRLPLNEECWLGVNGSPSGAAYQQGVRDYVNLLVANGVNVILDLHWNSGAFTNGPSWHCTDAHATCQKPVPDAEFAPQFWTGVANTFKGNNAVVFDLFNEPYPEIGNGSNQTLGWQCLRDGGTCTGIPYEVAGMQDLVDAVRATGATNIVMVSGLEWTNDMRQWLAHKPNDPTGNLVASWHAYSFNRCANIACWDSEIAPLAAQVPVVLSEFGQDSCGFDYVNSLLTWADAHGLSHLPWTWNPWGSCMILIRDWNGTPEPGFGEFYRTHLLAENPFA